jgi:hypothetical protein
MLRCRDDHHPATVSPRSPDIVVAMQGGRPFERTLEVVWPEKRATRYAASGYATYWGPVLPAAAAEDLTSSILSFNFMAN